MIRRTLQNRSRGESRRQRQGGFTLIEVAMVAAIVSLLAALAQPALQRVLVQARAAEAINNLNVIKVAIQNYEADFLTYPPEAGNGEIPVGLDNYLPDQFSFNFEGYELDYDNWAGPDGQPLEAGTFAIGLTVIPEDVTLGQAMISLIGVKIWNRDDRFTWVVID